MREIALIGEKREGRRRRMGFFCLGVGAVFLLYYVFLMAVRMDFAGIWLLAGLVLLAAGGTVFLERASLVTVPQSLKWGGGIIVLLLLAAFLFVEAKIVGGMVKRGEAKADYVLVLGAQVRGTKPSRALKRRLDAAKEYLLENPEAKAILSGGKGSGEEISEAEAMEEYLIEKGIPSFRLVREARSASTLENLKFSREFLDAEKDKVVIVTSDFHIFRALLLARKQGYRKVSALAAPSEPVYQPHYMVREFFALGKEWIFHNI